MPTTGTFIRDALIRAGDKGVVPADLFRERKAIYLELGKKPGLRKPTATMHSFEVFFAILVRLKWVEKTGIEEVAHRKGTMDELNPNIPRKYYRITAEGQSQPEEAWYNPIKTLMLLRPENYPKAVDGKYERKRKGEVILDTESKRFLIES